MFLQITRKNVLAVLLSSVIALLYSLPWLAFEPRASVTVNESAVAARIFYLFVIVFSTSLFFFYSNFLLAKILKSQPRVVRIVLHLLIQAVIVLAFTTILVLIAVLAIEVRAVKAYFVFYLLRNLIVAAVVGLLTYIIVLMEKLQKERMEVLMLENRNTESELATLRSQIDPHFIFNTLSTLGSLISRDNKKAGIFLEHLSDTFRYIMERRSNKLVLLNEELEFLKSYLYMMNSRFGEAIRLTVNVDADQVHLLPQFALQIAVENALKHNLVSPAHPMHVEITKLNDRLSVKNSLNRISAAGHGIGLANLSKRYLLSSGRDIEIRQTDSFFELSLPLL